MQIERFDRAHWLNTRWDYQRGQMVTILGPTGVGKSRTGFELLKHTPGIPATALVMKPRDPEPARWTRALGYREVPSWPPPPRWPWQEKPPGYTLWPRQSLTDHAADEALLYREFSKCLQDIYAHGDQIAFADEVAGLCDLPTPPGQVPLRRHLSAIWSRGRAMGVGLWAATQRPYGEQGSQGVPQHLYGAASHLLLGRDPEARNRKRFGEIGGVDPGVIESAVMQLRLHPIESGGVVNYVSELLHVMKGGPHGAYLCVVMPW
jgi:hypothetical protein